MANHAPLTAHERLQAERLLRRVKDAQISALMASKGSDAPQWMARAAHDYYWDISQELSRWIVEDNVVGIRSCLEMAHRIPLPRL